MPIQSLPGSAFYCAGFKFSLETADVIGTVARSTRISTRYVPTAEDRAFMRRLDPPIGWHPRGGWCRRFPGELNQTYFGKVPPAEAVRRHGAEEQRRKTGEPEDQTTALTVRDAANLFFRHLDAQYDAGAMSAGQRASYGDELARLVESVGRTVRLSELCKLTAPESVFRPLRAAAIKRGLFAAEKHVTQVRTFLSWCSTTRRYMPAPFYADAFDAPSEREKKAKAKAVRREKGAAFWTPAEVREIVDAAKADSIHRYAQILLMLNGGMGASDVSNLEDADVDWERRCIHTDRSKTLVPRVVPLWDRTLAAMRESRAERPTPEGVPRFFLTQHGRPLVVETIGENRRNWNRTDAIRNWLFTQINGRAHKGKRVPGPLAHLKRHRAGPYTFRAIFATLAMGGGFDPNLEAVILGQKFTREILGWYVRGDQLEKLRRIVLHVESQIWP